jgi:hypothetical protein
MKVIKVLFVLFCLLAFAWTFSRPIHAQTIQLASISSQNPAAVTNTLPFKLFVERICPLFADRLMTSKIADIPAGHPVTVLKKIELNPDKRLVVLLVSYTDRDGKEKCGWVSGTLHVHMPH